MTNEEILEKAFWHWHDGFGEIAVDSMDGFWIDDTEPIWKQHLQQMVLEKEPLKYLEKFL